MARPRSDIKARIVEAATTRFCDAGVDATSLRSIAKDARTSIGMVYYYFPTKDDLFLAVVEEVYARLLRDFARALDPKLCFEDRISALYTRIGALSDDERRIIRLVVVEALMSSPRLVRLVERFKRGHVPLLLNLVADGLRHGALRSDIHPFVLMASTVSVGVLPQLVVRVLKEHLPEAAAADGEALIGQLQQVLFHGVARER